MKIYTHETGGGVIDTDLAGELKRIIELPGADIAVELVSCSNEQAHALREWDSVIDFGEQTLNIFGLDSTEYRVLVSAGRSSDLRSYCLHQCSHAEWGAQFGCVAVQYVQDRLKLVTQIHECLHFLGVDDCYIADHPSHPPKNSCDNEKCLMRYGVESREVCGDVLRQLQNGQIAFAGLDHAV